MRLQFMLLSHVNHEKRVAWLCISMHACSSLSIVMVIKGCQRSTINDDYNEAERHMYTAHVATETQEPPVMMVKMASGIAHGHIPVCKTTKSCNMAAILQLKSQPRQHTFLIWDIHVMIKINDTYTIKVSADQYHMTILPAPVLSS